MNECCLKPGCCFGTGCVAATGATCPGCGILCDTRPDCTSCWSYAGCCWLPSFSTCAFIRNINSSQCDLCSPGVCPNTTDCNLCSLQTGGKCCMIAGQGCVPIANGVCETCSTTSPSALSTTPVGSSSSYSLSPSPFPAPLPSTALSSSTPLFISPPPIPSPPLSSASFPSSLPSSTLVSTSSRSSSPRIPRTPRASSLFSLKPSLSISYFN